MSYSKSWIELESMKCVIITSLIIVMATLVVFECGVDSYLGKSYNAWTLNGAYSGAFKEYGKCLKNLEKSVKESWNRC